MTLRDGSYPGETGSLVAHESGLSGLVAGLVTALVLVLSVLAAMAIGLEESNLVAQVQATATVTPTQRATAVVMPPPSATPTPTSLPPTPGLPPSSTPEPVSTLVPSPTCVPPAGWRVYVIQAGESLAVLAARYRTTEAALQRANCLPSPHLTPGQTIHVPPVAATSTPCRPPSNWVRYTVKRGDTLSDLARRVGSTVAALKQANCRSGDTIYVGETLWVPRLPVTPPPPTRTPSVTPGPTSTSVTATPSPTGSGTIEPTESATPTPPATGSVEPTETSLPPTETSLPPTETSLPPTNVVPSDTPRPTVAPSDTPRPTPVPTETPVPTKEPEPSPVPSDEP